jgi:hypothetical protein
MKKMFLTLILSILSLTGFSQSDSTKKNDVLCLNTTVRVIGYTLNTPRLQTYYQPTPYVGVNLHLSNSKGNYVDQDTRRNTYLGIFLSGIAFTSAAILESGDFKIYQGETARQIMLGVGITLTLTGGIGMISTK